MTSSNEDDARIERIVQRMLKTSRGETSWARDDRVQEFISCVADYAEDVLRSLQDTVKNEKEWLAGLSGVKSWSEDLRQKHATALGLVSEGIDELYTYTTRVYGRGIGYEAVNAASLGDYITEYIAALARVREIKQQTFFSELGFSDRTMLAERTARSAMSKVVTPAAAPAMPPPPPVRHTSTAATNTSQAIEPDDSVSQIIPPLKRQKSSGGGGRPSSRWEGASMFSDVSSHASRASRATHSSRASRATHSSRASKAASRIEKRTTNPDRSEERSTRYEEGAAEHDAVSARVSAAKAPVVDEDDDVKTFRFCESDTAIDDVYTNMF